MDHSSWFVVNFLSFFFFALLLCPLCDTSLRILRYFFTHFALQKMLHRKVKTQKEINRVKNKEFTSRFFALPANGIVYKDCNEQKKSRQWRDLFIVDCLKLVLNDHFC